MHVDLARLSTGRSAYLAAMSRARVYDASSKLEKINGDLFVLTYGAIVTQLVKDYEDIAEVNRQLELMGYNIGTRIVDEFFAKSGVDKCRSFKDTADNIAGVAFSMFLGVTGDVSGWNADYTCCNITLRHNPLTEFVELPGHCAELHYSNLICGAVRGALEMVQMRVECSFTKDTLHGDSTNVIRLELKELVEDEAGDDYKDD